MTVPHPQPDAVFSGALGDTTSGTYHPARAEVSSGMVSVWVVTPAGWTLVFSVPAHEVVVKSAAQRITLVVRGQSYPLLADPGAVARANQYGIAGGVADVLNKPQLAMSMDMGRGASVAGGARSFYANGGPGFVAAARQSGARTSRLGYGPIVAIGCGAGLVVVVVVTAITVFVLRQ